MCGGVYISCVYAYEEEIHTQASPSSLFGKPFEIRTVFTSLNAHSKVQGSSRSCLKALSSTHLSLMLLIMGPLLSLCCSLIFLTLLSVTYETWLLMDKEVLHLFSLEKQQFYICIYYFLKKFYGGMKILAQSLCVSVRL